MTIACDRCGKAVDDSLLQMDQEGNEILYLCPECYLGRQEQSPEESA